MGKKLISILTIFLLIASIFIFVSCDKDEDYVDPPMNKEIHITFISNNHLEVETKVAKAGDQLELFDLEVKGYNFDGWYTNNSYDTLFTSTTFPTHSINLYAKWSLVQYHIAFYNLGDEEINFELRYYDDNVLLKTPIRSGYTFDGWFYDEDLKDRVESMHLRMPDRDLNIYAKWLENSIISFEMNGANEIDDLETYRGANIVAPATPIYKGYYFMGWYLDNEFSSDVYEFSVMPDDNITLWAKWEIKQIFTKNDLLLLNAQPSAGYELMNDIDLNGEDWEPITVFNGIINGNNYKIYNYSISNKIGAALIAANNGEIRNLIVSNYTITIDKEYSSVLYIGGLVGHNTGDIINCKSYGNISINNPKVEIYLGGLVGYATGNLKIKDSVFEGSIYYSNSEWTHIGGILGYGRQAISIVNCISSGTILSDNVLNASVHIGGIAGFIQGTVGSVELLHSDMSIDIKGNNSNIVGGIVGRLIYGYLIVTRCSFNGKITISNGNPKVGGIVGHNERSRISESYSDATISITAVARPVYLGGIVGHSNNSYIFNTYSLSVMTITNCTNMFFGGIVGYNEGEYSHIGKSYNEGELNIIRANGNINYMGGIVGYANGSIADCYSVSDLFAGHSNIIGEQGINGKIYIGGIAGQIVSDSTIMTSYNTGDLNVIAKNETYAGGIVGNAEFNEIHSVIADCYSTGDITVASSNSSISYVGGIVGRLDYKKGDGYQAVFSCYSSSNILVTGNDIYAGGITGRVIRGRIISSFYLGNVTASGSGNVYTSGVVAGFNSSNNISKSYFASDCVITGGEVKASPPYPRNRETLLDEDFLTASNEMNWNASLWSYGGLPILVYDWDDNIWDYYNLTVKGNPTFVNY